MKGLIFTYALTYGGAAMSLFWPFYGLLIYFCFAIIKPEAMWYWSVEPGSYSRIIAIALLVGWAATGFGNWNLKRATLTVYALLGFLAWNIISASVASDKALAWSLIEERFKVILPFIAGITLVESVRQLKQIAWVIFASLAYLAFELNYSYSIQGFNRLTLVGFGGMDNNTVSIAMVCGCGLAFFLGINETIAWRKWLAFAGAAMMAHVPMFGDSRGGMLALIITGIVSFLLIPKQSKHYFAFALAMIFGWFVLAGPGVRERLMTAFAAPKERDESAESRIILWGQCWQFMTAEPFLGVGPGQFPLRVAPLWGGFPKEAHSLWLQTGAELGFPGLLFLIIFYGSVVWRLLGLVRIGRGGGTFGFLMRLGSASKESDAIDPWLRGAARMVIASLIGFIVASSFVTVTGIEPPYYVALLGAGVLKLASQQAQEIESTASQRRYSDESAMAMAR